MNIERIFDLLDLFEQTNSSPSGMFASNCHQDSRSTAHVVPIVPILSRLLIEATQEPVNNDRDIAEVAPLLLQEEIAFLLGRAPSALLGEALDKTDSTSQSGSAVSARLRS